MSDEDLDRKVVTLFGDQVKKPDDPIATVVTAFSEKHAAITIEGKFWIMRQDGNKLTFSTEDDFIKTHRNKKVTVTTTSASSGNQITTEKPMTIVWLESPKRRQYKGLVCDPQYKSDPGLFNTWNGFAIKPVQGDCSLVLDFLRDVICGGNKDDFHHNMQFYSHMFQKPWEKPEYAIVNIGDKGVGKTFWAKSFEYLINGSALDGHFYETANPNDIFGNHLGHLLYKVMWHLEEVTWGGDRKHEGILNNYITGRRLSVDIKWGPYITINNIVRLQMSANPGWAVPASHDERRYMMNNVSSAHQKDYPYFRAISDQLNRGGYEALMWEFMNHDISDFNYRDAPMTHGLHVQKKFKFTDFENWWYNILKKGQIQFIASESDGERVYVGRKALYDTYIREMSHIGSRQRRLTEDIELRKYLPLVRDGKVVMSDDGRRVVSIVTVRKIYGQSGELRANGLPLLAVCRELWDFRFKGNEIWEEPDEWEQVEYSTM